MKMCFLIKVLLLDLLMIILGVSSKNITKHNGISRIVAGLDDLRPINDKLCRSKVIENNRILSSPIECARTCSENGRPKTCYYSFVAEYYSVNGGACKLCTPNITNSFCSTCQCVPGDGIERTLLTINRMLPGPSIEVCLGDTIVVDVFNQLPDSTLSIHWHGVFQTESPYYDGVPFVTQCPIPQDNVFRYQFKADNPGTHFWHSHVGLQKMDGLFGSLIVRQPERENPNRYLYDYDLSRHVIIINDWMHKLSVEKVPGLLRNFTRQLPETVLINGKGRYKNPTTGTTTNTPIAVFTVKRNYRYRFRLINAFCSVCPGSIAIQDHPLNIIATDGEDLIPTQVNTILSFAGERYDFVLNANKPPGSYWIQVRGVGECEKSLIQQVAILRYENGPSEPNIEEPSYYSEISNGILLNPIDDDCTDPKDDVICVTDLRSAHPVRDKGLLKKEPDVKIYLPIGFHVYNQEKLFTPNTYLPFSVPTASSHLIGIINNISFTFPSSPLLSQFDDIPKDLFCNGSNRPIKDNNTFSRCLHMIHIPYDAVVEMILVDTFQAPNVSHPFHLHGYTYRLMTMNHSSDKEVKKISLFHVMDLDRRNLIPRHFNNPPAKDTLRVPYNGYVVLRFRANNPGFWLFHCHFAYHQLVGMDMVLHVGKLKYLPPKPSNFPTCGNYLPPIIEPYNNSEYAE